MDHEQLRLHIGANLTKYRKALGLTQVELAQKLNYSDKAVSKWERGESVPDVLTLTLIASQFGVTVNDLVYGEEAPVPAQPVEEPPKKYKPDPHITTTRRIVQGLVCLLVLAAALFIYVVVDEFDVPYSWMSFILAVPALAITLLSLRSAWHDYSWNFSLISLILWGFLVFFHLLLYFTTARNLWKLYVLGGLGQIFIALWFLLLRRRGSKHEQA